MIGGAPPDQWTDTAPKESAVDVFLKSSGLLRHRLKPETTLQRLRRERPELFLSKQERDDLKYQWGDTIIRQDMEKNWRNRNLCAGAPAPLLTEAGRAIRQRETNTEKCRRYRQRQAIARAKKKRLDAEAAPVQPPADGQVS